MALTKVTGSVIKDSVSLSGNVSIGGTLTYEDVTNVDSVGVITARNGLHVTGGNFGIGTNNPTKLLEIFGTDPTIKLRDSSGDAYALIEGDSADQGSLRFRADPLGAGSGTHIRFDTDGTERLRIASNGDIGLGTVPETDSFQPSLYFAGGNANIWGSGNANLYTAVNVRYTGGGGWKYNNDGLGSYTAQQSGTWEFRNAPSGTADNVATFTTRVHINSAGNVRIGSGAPALAVGSGLEIDTGGAATLRLEDSSVGSSFEIQNTGSVIKQRMYNNQPWVIEHGSGEKVRVDNSGRVLINTTTTYPSNQMLYVKGGSPSTVYDGQVYLEGSETSGAINTGGTLLFGGHDGGTARTWGAIRTLKEDGTSGNYGSYMAFLTRPNGSAPTERFRINSLGNVEIGTATDAGNTLRYFDIANYNTGNSAGVVQRLLTRKSDGTSAAGLDIVKYKAGGAYLINYETIGSNGFIAFSTGENAGAPAERVRITSAGELGVNTTAPVEKLGISGNMRFVNPTGTTSRITALPSGSYNTGTTGGSAVCFQRFADGGGGSDEIFFETHWQGNRHGESMRINKYGHVITPNQPSFNVTVGGGQLNSNVGVIVFTNTTTLGNHNTGNHYNTSNGRFTAPVAGRYQINARMLTNSSTNAYMIYLLRVNANHHGYIAHNHSDYWLMESGSWVLNLQANDYVDCYLQLHSGHGGFNYASFSGFLIG